MRAVIYKALILFCLVSGAEAQSSKIISRIAFGSCSRESDSVQMWSDILTQKPDLWIWMGDNIYGDSRDLNVLKQKYAVQKNRKEYQQLIQTMPVTGTWDDHDYGMNDGGKYFSKKKESRELMLDFLGVPANDPVRTHEGVYNAHTYGSGKRKVKIINLDTRYFRDTIIREYYIDTITHKKLYRNLPNETGDMLGEAQWKWLTKELDDSDAQLNIINSSIQVLSEQHRFEKWANLPASRKRLLDLINTAKAKNILIISGDRHIAEISEIKLKSLQYPLIDFTSSGLTHTWEEPWKEDNIYRKGDLIIQKNFGMILIDWSGKDPKVSLQVRGHGNKLYLEQQVQFH
jgi:alkaline phosphatase D